MADSMNIGAALVNQVIAARDPNVKLASAIRRLDWVAEDIAHRIERGLAEIRHIAQKRIRVHL